MHIAGLQEFIQLGLLDAIAEIYTDPDEARRINDTIGFPPGYAPVFPPYGDAITFWYEVGEAIEAAKLVNGFTLLFEQLKRDFPGHPTIHKIVTEHAAANPPPATTSDPTPTTPPTLPTGDFDAFISYSSSDRPLVRLIAAELENQGVHVWFDQWNIQSGAAFVSAIENILEQVKAVLVFCGTEGYGKWQKAEVNVALDMTINGKCKLIPVVLPGVTPEKLSPFLRQYNAIVVPPGDDQTQRITTVVEKLVQAIKL